MKAPPSRGGSLLKYELHRHENLSQDLQCIVRNHLEPQLVYGPSGVEVGNGRVSAATSSGVNVGFRCGVADAQFPFREWMNENSHVARFSCMVAKMNGHKIPQL